MSLTLVSKNPQTPISARYESGSQKQPSQWHAYLHLELVMSQRGVVLKNSAHKGPLYIQKPFYPEGRDLAHLYVLHPPGGLVSGDHLSFATKQGTKAQCLITTPGAGRVYKARSDKQLQIQSNSFTLAEGASLEWLPQETILYPDANTKLETQVDLAKNALFIGWEISCFGLPASQAYFDKGSVSQTFEIRQEGEIKVREKLLINDKKRSLLTQVAGFNQQTVNALMVAGPFSIDACFISDPPLETLIIQLQNECDHLNQINKSELNSAMASMSLCGEFLLIRYLGMSSEQAKQLFVICWQKIRPLLLQRDACIPRIWAT